jgi:hypothetical protein
VLAGIHLDRELRGAALETQAAPSGGSGPAAEIRELVELRDSGALSEAELQAAKARLLDS